MLANTSVTGSNQSPQLTARSNLSDERSLRYAIVAIAVCARIAFGMTKLQSSPADPDHYLALAESLLNGQGFSFEGRPTAYRPPLYPILLTPMVALMGSGKAFHVALVLFQAAIGGATAWLAMSAASKIGDIASPQDLLTSERSSQSKLVTLIAGFWTALDPLLIIQAPLVMTEALAAFLLTAAVRALFHDRPRTAGFWFGAASLCRPSLLICAGLTILSRLAPLSTSPFARRVRDSFSILIVCGLVISPWAIRNWYRLGEPVLTTTHGGYTLALANNAIYYEDVVFGPPHAVWTGPRQQAWMDAIGTDTIGLTEPEADRKIRAKATDFILANPEKFAISCLHRQLRFWAVAPAAGVYSTNVRMFCAIWTLPIWIMAGIALCRGSSWRWPVIATIAVAAGLAAVHVVYWTDIRMRAPIVPTLAILAANGVLSTLRSIKR